MRSAPSYRCSCVHCLRTANGAIARALVHIAAFLGAQSKLHYLALMFTDIRVLSAPPAAFLAGVCWMLVLARLNVGYAYPFVTLSCVLVPIGAMCSLAGRCRRPRCSEFVFTVAGATISALV
jgi:hypothetical protein